MKAKAFMVMVWMVLKKKDNIYCSTHMKKFKGLVKKNFWVPFEQVEQSSDYRCVLANCPRTCL